MLDIVSSGIELAGEIPCSDILIVTAACIL